MDYPNTFDCPKCGVSLPFTPRPETSHYGHIRCPNHGFLWIAKPADERKQARRNNKDLRPLLSPDQQGYCWQCRREEDHLRQLRPSVALQVHHIIEVKEGGTDDPTNLQLVCAECHAEIHRRREAFSRYRAAG